MKSLFGFFWSKLRLSKPWNAKIPFLISLLYVFILIGNMPFNTAMLSFVASITLIVGLAGLAYLLNDWGDKNVDNLVNKPNVTRALNLLQLNLLVLLLLLMIVLPWFYLPFNTPSLIFLVIELLLFLIYALPPLRLKERGTFGVICDALYAHALPAIFASYTYAMLSDTKILYAKKLIFSLFIWQFILGVRNIIFHQIQDYEHDKNTKAKTFVVSFGPEQSIELVNKILLLELLLLFCFFLVLWYYFGLSMFLLCFLIYCLITYTIVKSKFNAMDYRSKAYLFLDDFYIQWLPLISLFLVLLLNPWYSIIAVLHLILFKNKIKVKMIEFYKRVVRRN